MLSLRMIEDRDCTDQQATALWERKEPAAEHGRAVRLALRIVQAGALLVVLAASTYRLFELDRFFVPKELVLHVTACLAGLLLARAFRRTAFARVDLLLVAFLALGVVSAALAANPWYAARAVAVTASGIALFWVGRILREAGLERQLLGGLAAAVVVASITALLQTYGVRTDFFSANRAPGGTLGNRNFVAHIAAFGLPVVLYTALEARRFTGFLLGAAGAAVVTASLALTRSRAAWLAVAAAGAILLASMVIAPALRRSGRTWLRLALLLALAGGAVLGAVSLPNTLRWRSDNPYLESVRGVTNFREGSGAGRLVQYRRSLLMGLRDPLLGVGPGNWAVEYPGHAPSSDPSLDRNEPGTTSNPWPSSDWVAFASERGLPAALLLALAFAGIIIAGLRQLTGGATAEQALAAAAMIATLVAASVAGMFDAVLLLAAPALLVWTTLGALWSPRTIQAPRFPRAAVGALVVVSLLAGVGALRSAGQLAAIGLSGSTRNVTAWSVAARLDPGNYRVRLRLARDANGRETRCGHAHAAHSLQPNASAARRLERRCD
jgi:O-antigen ligase